MTLTPEGIKACCADVYASEWIRLLVGESFHPGGLALTERLGQLLGIDSSSRVLDLAAGRGTSALHLARVFGCHVVGVDYSSTNVERAKDQAEREGLLERVDFVQADAERLSDFADQSLDVVLCECAYCTFPDKHAAAAEIARVLVPGGRFGLSDLTRNGALPPELDGLAGWIACVADAQPLAGYVAGVEAVGLAVDHIEAHDEALTELIDKIRGRLVAADLLAKIQNAELPNGIGLQLAKQLARAGADAVKAGKFGYSLIIASRPRQSK